MMEPVLKLEKHPFYLGPVASDAKLDFPTEFPFYLDVHPQYALPAVILSDDIRAALAKAYSLGSMLSTPLGESTLSTGRMVEVRDKILSLFSGSVEGVKLLEVGCGRGALLNEFKMRGADVRGVEIGPQGQEGARKYGFKVIDQPLESATITEQFDCIYSYACIEHIEALDRFFEASRKYLKDGALFLHVVPNNEFQFNLGYLDHLVHEHINYFTAENGVRLFIAQGFRSVQAGTTNAGNELFVWGYYDSTAPVMWPGDNAAYMRTESEQLKKYADKAHSRTDEIVAALQGMQSVGLYAGGFEYSGYLNNAGSIRYFDGDSYKHGKSWLLGLPAIEPPQALVNNPVEHLIVCKDHYYDAIVRYLYEEVKIPDSIQIHKLEDLGG